MATASLEERPPLALNLVFQRSEFDWQTLSVKKDIFADEKLKKALKTEQPSLGKFDDPHFLPYMKDYPPAKEWADGTFEYSKNLKNGMLDEEEVEKVEAFDTGIISKRFQRLF